MAELVPADGGPGDQVQTYFGMRTVSRGQSNGKRYEYILLNGEPVYLRGALDQAFHPDSLHAYPSDEVVRGDIELAEELDLNTLRCHIKVNDPRYYYWADKLGLLILYDMSSYALARPDGLSQPPEGCLWHITTCTVPSFDFCCALCLFLGASRCIESAALRRTHR